MQVAEAYLTLKRMAAEGSLADGTKCSATLLLAQSSSGIGVCYPYAVGLSSQARTLRRTYSYFHSKP